jgi:hypothetical protein
MPPVNPNISPEALKALDDFKQRMEEINDQIVDMGDELGDNLVKKLTKVAFEAKNIIDPLKEAESLSKKISEIAEETAILHNQEAILSRNYVKSLQNGNKEEQKKLLKKLDQVRSNIDLNQQLMIEFQTLKEVGDIEKKILEIKQKQIDAEKEASKVLIDQIKSALSFKNIMGSAIVKAVLAVDTQVANLSRSLGVSYNSAKGIRNEMESFAFSANDGFTTVARLAKAQADLTEQLGIAVDFGNEETQQFAKLTELVGLSAGEAGKLANFSAAAGMSTSDYLKDVRAAGFASQQANKIHISDKQLLQSISSLSAGILVKFQGNPKALADAVVQAKKFGLTLEQVDKTGESLLNFETSIENELKAELITGKQLNLERARAAALTGDQATLMQEVASQAGSLAEFQNMNVIAQRSLAEAFGMSSNEMADMLMKQEAINKYGSEAEKLNAQQLKDFEESGLSLEDYLKKQAEQVDIQTKFNTAMDRLQEILGNMAAGPLGTILSIFADLLSNSTALAAILGGVMVMNLIKMVTVLKQAKKLSYAAAISDIISSAYKSVGMLPGVGMILAGAAAAAGIAYLASQSQSVEDGIAPPGGGPFTITDKFGATAITAAGDGIAVSPNINKGGGGGDNAGLMTAINELRSAVNALATKPVPAMAIQVGAEKLGEVVGRQAETGTNQYKNAYRLA